MRPGSWTASAASPWTWAVVGITATRMSWSVSAVLAAIWAARTESWSLGSTTTSCAPDRLDRLEQHPGRGPVAGAAVDDDGAGLLEQLGQPRPRGDRDDRPAGRAGLRLAGGDLLGEVGHPDPVRPAGLDAGLDGGAHVVDVDVDVPEPLAADHDQGVAEPGEGAAQRRDGLVGGVEEVHHLVRRPAVHQVGAGLGARSGRGIRSSGLDRRRPLAGERGLGGVEDHHDAAAAGVDHPGVAEDLELVGGPRERLAGRGGAGGEHVARPDRRLALEQRRGRLGGGPADRQHRALDRRTDRRVARLGRLLAARRP